jgi:hypothetical protein
LALPQKDLQAQEVKPKSFKKKFKKTKDKEQEEFLRQVGLPELSSGAVGSPPSSALVVGTGTPALVLGASVLAGSSLWLGSLVGSLAGGSFLGDIVEGGSTSGALSDGSVCCSTPARPKMSATDACSLAPVSRK